MDMQTAVRTVVQQKYAQFDGRASRSEYWWYVLAYIIAFMVLGFIDGLLFGDSRPLQLIASLGLLIPSLAVVVRRLHDINRSGWWYLIVFIPVIGFFVMLYWLVQPSENEGNIYGELDPE